MSLPSPQSAISYRRAFISVRPGRIATLFPSEEHWRATITRILEVYSRTWGGAGNIIVPITNQSFHPAFRPVLELFDPDVLAEYHFTYMDLKLRDPSEYEKWLTRSSDREAAKGGLASDKIREFLNSDATLREWRSRIALDPDTSSYLRSRLTPNEFNGELRFHGFSADQAPGPGLTDMSDHWCRTGKYPVFDVEEVDSDLQLTLVSRTGQASPSFEAKGLEKETIKVGLAEIDESFELAWTGEINQQKQRMRSMFMKALKQDLPNDHWIERPGLIESFLLNRTLHGCGRFGSFESPLPTLLVVGDTAADFCFWDAIRKLGRNAIWIPEHLLASTTEFADKFLVALSRHLIDLQHSETHGLLEATSLSIPVEHVNDRLKSLRSKGNENNFRERLDADVVDSIAIKFSRPPRILDKLIADRASYEALAGSNLARPLETPIPSVVTDEPLKHIKWYVDVRVDGHLAPPRTSISRLLSNQRKVGQFGIRASNEGITFHSHREGFVQFEGRPDQVLSQPSLHLPSASECVAAVLETAGLRFKYSQSGQYAMAALRLWGGVEPLAADFGDPTIAGFLKSFLSTDKSGASPGVYFPTVKRRYLTFPDLQLASGLSDSQVRDLIDRYLNNGILAPGLCLKCPECHYSGWYLLESAVRSFACQRCRLASAVSTESWRDPISQPHWYYELVEVVYQAVKDNIDVPILALDKLRRNTRSFDFLAPIDVYRASALIGELDFFAISDGKITIGEAKKVGDLGSDKKDRKKKVRTLREMADAMTADRVILATTDSSFGPESKKEIEIAFAGSRSSIEYFEGLGAQSGPNPDSPCIVP